MGKFLSYRLCLYVSLVLLVSLSVYVGMCGERLPQADERHCVTAHDVRSHISWSTTVLNAGHA